VRCPETAIASVRPRSRVWGPEARCVPHHLRYTPVDGPTLRPTPSRRLIRRCCSAPGCGWRTSPAAGPSWSVHRCRLHRSRAYAGGELRERNGHLEAQALQAERGPEL